MENTIKVDSRELQKKAEQAIKSLLKERKKLDNDEILAMAGIDIDIIKETSLYTELVEQIRNIKNKALFKEIEKEIKAMSKKGEKVDHDVILNTLGVSAEHTPETIPLYAHITDIIKNLKTDNIDTKNTANNKGKNQENKKVSARNNKKTKKIQGNSSAETKNENIGEKKQEDMVIASENSSVEVNKDNSSKEIIEQNNIEILEEDVILEQSSSNVYGLNVKGIVTMIKQQRVALNLYSDNNDVQRNEVWDNNKKSLLIDTILSDDVEVPTLIFVKKGDIYMVADGKQRLISITSFVNDGFKLSKATKKVGDIEIANLKFSQLPEELQDKILNSKITFQEIEYKSDEQVAEIFVRLNSGEKLKPVEIWRASLGNKLPFVQKVAKHRCFKYFNFTRSQVIRFYDVETALDLIMEELVPGSDHNKKTKENFVASNSKYADFVDDFKNSIETKLDYFADTFEGKDKETVKIVTTSANKIIVYRVIDVAINSGISAQEFYTFLEGYFTNKKNSYDRIAGKTSTSNKSSLEKRYKHLLNELKKYIKNIKTSQENINNSGETA